MNALNNETLQEKLPEDGQARLRARTVRNEQLMTIGRLTSSIVHEINNPLQAIRGAITLALEEMDDRQALFEYLKLGHHETERIIKLINLIRQIYRPDYEQMENVDLQSLLQSTVEITRDEANRLGVQLSTDDIKQAPAVSGNAQLLLLAFITITLKMIDAIGEAGGGKICVVLNLIDSKLQLEFSTSTIVNKIDGMAIEAAEPEDAVLLAEKCMDLSIIRDVFLAHFGTIIATVENDLFIIRIEYTRPNT